ncbi:SDR family oxidoreductase [Raineyella sp. LH-20]|uniref:SDR family oxidoreductase n=1 Tax=Raineyella sp. LH-20 TaxID=3081204 RepID=UPI002953CB88|nr:SDR family oxidoreductase [Raineyella sp. LH-20]WOP17977.1 SDR family oxidoreductase [Raineyella sp. LH-20]
MTISTDIPEVVGPPPLGGRLRDLLAGKKIVMTGATGFIGEQLLWKILTELPDTTPAVLVRRKGSASARDRVITLVGKAIFRDLVKAAGGKAELVDSRIEVIEGDLPNVPPLPRDLDVVLHCAGDVSFDPPIDKAFATNTVGTRALMDAMLAAVTDASGALTKVPHYVHVSTAYTAGRRRGVIPEAQHVHDIDYDTETTWGLKLKETIEVESRTPERLTRLRRQAERVHRKAGYLTTARDTEQRRQDWVHDKLVEAGTERARSLGWTDCYTFTKALGERVVADVGRHIRVSVVRPAIVESSLTYPYPGWIEGFKMADPIILAYGKGNMPELPASPDSVIDIVPCDMVVNATLAVCATEPEIGKPVFYHVNSGARNPLTFADLYDHVRSYFLEHPLTPGGRGAAHLPTWSFPGAQRVDQLLNTSTKAYQFADMALKIAPRVEVFRRLARDLDKGGEQIAFLRRYLTIYGEYLRSEVTYLDDNTLALHNQLDPADVEAFAFDSSVYDWKDYIEGIHCPAVTKPVRRMEELKRRRNARPATYRELTPAKQPGTVLAAFDLDGTVLNSDVIRSYLWARLPELGRWGRTKEVAALIRDLPGYLWTENRDRGAFLRALYRRYRGADLSALEEFVDRELTEVIMDRLAPEAIRRVREHREAGHVTVLLTGTIRPFTRPLVPLFDEIVAADLATDAQGRCTGYLTGPPLVGESRPAWLRYYAATHDIDLTASYAYADSHADESMLRAVGNPVAVNPDVPLMRVAQADHWSIVEWSSHSAGSRNRPRGR